MKRITKTWLQQYFGLRLQDYGKGKFVQTDGGYGTWDFDRLDNAEKVYQSSSKTYWFIKLREVGR